MKGQINLEFVTTAFLFIAAIGVLLTAGSNVLPGFQDSVNEASLMLEARYISNTMMTQPGSHSYGNGGTEWEKNLSTARNANSFGLATDYHVFDKEKIENLTDVGSGGLNYTRFKTLTGAKNQYHFTFTRLPIVETHKSFTRGSPPSNPPITEPTGSPYNRVGNEVHYGSIRLNGNQYTFLVTSRNGVYNGTWISPNWNFAGVTPISEGDTVSVWNDGFELRNIQNREREPGASIMLQKKIKEFGAAVDDASTVKRLNRYGVLDGELLRMTVLVW